MRIKANWARAVLIMALASLVALPPSGAGAQNMGNPITPLWENTEINGYIETRAGWRTGHDANERDTSVMETRLQVEAFTYTDTMDFKYKGDVWADGIQDKVEYDTREAWVFTRAPGDIDLTIGRQILTWGTGDLVFLNDMFPKDWQSFFLGRDDEYLKAPSDALKLSFFREIAGIDIVYIPRFNPDRYITGEYLSHWNGSEDKISGRDHILEADQPDQWFQDHEIALRIFRRVQSWELALYGYSGFWKTPSGEDDEGNRGFADLNVYGASVRGAIGAGIANMEFAWYDSRDDSNGTNPLVNNSQLRYLVGYTQDLDTDLNASLQYYAEQMLDYSAYEAGIKKGTVTDRIRHVMTLQLTKLLMNQTLILNLSGFYCPGDKDAYLRPKLTYQYTDNLVFQAGANIFFGRDSHTAFSQFENNTNIYAAIRYHY